MSNTSLPVPHRWGTLTHLARHRNVSERTARLWAQKGYLNLYRIRGVRGVVVDLDEADRMLNALPPGTIKPGWGTFGGQIVRNLVTEVKP